MADVRQLYVATGVLSLSTTSATLNTQALSATTHKLAFAFQAHESATISHLGFRYGTRTGTPPTYRISLQSLDTSGNPTGTVLGGGSPASATFTPPADNTWNNTWQWVALSNSLDVSKGAFYAVVIDYSSGTIDGSNNSSFARHTSLYGGQIGFPYYVQDTTGSWVKGTNQPIFGYKSSSQVYGFPLKSLALTDSATSGTRIAQRVLFNSAMGQTYQPCGVAFHGRINAAGTTFKIGVWQTDGTELATESIDADFVGTAGANTGLRFAFSSPPTLNFGTAYYAGIEAGGGTNFNLVRQEFESNAELAALPGGGEFYLATYNGSAWSTDNKVRPMLDLCFDDWSQPSALVFPTQQPVFVASGFDAIGY